MYLHGDINNANNLEIALNLKSISNLGFRSSEFASLLTQMARKFKMTSDAKYSNLSAFR